MQSACAVLYCHLWPVWIYNIFPHYLTSVTIFREKKLLNIKWVVWFSLQLLSETFLVSERHCHKYTNNFIQSTRYSFQILIISDSSRVLLRGQTDRQTARGMDGETGRNNKAYIRFLQSGKRAQKLERFYEQQSRKSSSSYSWQRPSLISYSTLLYFTFYITLFYWINIQIFCLIISFD